MIEYLVVNLRDAQVHGFDLRRGGPLRPRQGVHRSRCFYGLWVHGPALLAGDAPLLLRTVGQGLASLGHARFVERLARARLLAGPTTPPP